MKGLIAHATDIIKAASASPLGILALGILAFGVLAYVLIGRQSTSEGTRAIILLAILTAIVAYGYAVVRAIPAKPGGDVYRLRVTVLDPNDVPTGDARMWSSVGGEPMRVAGGWQFDIPTAKVPIDGLVTLYIARDAAFLQGKTQVKLGADMSPAVTVKLVRETSVTVSGIVVDASGKSVADVRISVIGHGYEAVATDATGGFVLPSHAADGQQVELHAEKAGYKAASQFHPAGNEPATIVLERE